MPAKHHAGEVGRKAPGGGRGSDGRAAVLFHRARSLPYPELFMKNFTE